MTVIFILILASLTLAGVFLGGFIWAVRSGQFEDICTPSMRILTEEARTSASAPPPAKAAKNYSRGSGAAPPGTGLPASIAGRVR